ncbi:hypothetical protein FACS189481_2350 [Clostridia bacterium]|nr:hypothetical protein FACS189481_2350 [Clostridia bacterium]
MDRDYWYHWYTKHPKQKPADYDMAPGFGINPGAKEFIKNNPDIPEKIKQKMLKKSKRKHHRAKKKHHRRTKHKKRRNGKKDTAKARNSEDQALGDLKVLMECSDYVKINPEAYKLPAGIYDEEF